MGAPVRFQKAVSRSKEKRRSGAPKGAPVRVMGRQFPPAGGTGSAARRANGCGVPRPRISALRFPLFGSAKGSNTKFGTTARRDAPRGNAPTRLNTCTEDEDAPIKKAFWRNEPKTPKRLFPVEMR